MRKFCIIGKTPQMRSMFVRRPDGRMVQTAIKLGMRYELTEDEMTFHIKRQGARGYLKILEVEEPKVEEPKVEEPKVEEPTEINAEEPVADRAIEEPVLEEAQVPKKRRRRKRTVDQD